MVERQYSSLQSIRDRTILYVGFAGAFRRSELACLAVTDVQLPKNCVVITLPRSKADQEGEGYIKGIPEGSTISYPYNVEITRYSSLRRRSQLR